MLVLTRGPRGTPQKETENGPVPSSWRVVPVSEAVQPLEFDAHRQVPASEYAPSGRWPIVDQGRSQIAGYTDDATRLVDREGPVILFGDHTRTIKFADFDFALGAQGTRPLVATEPFDPRFLFYALSNLQIPDRGYNRHFGVFRELSVPLPPIDEQRAVASALTCVRDAVRTNDRVVSVVSRLKRAAMRMLFTRGLRGGSQRETEIGSTPRGWQVRELGSLCLKTRSVDLVRDGDQIIRYVDVSSVSRDSLRIESSTRWRLNDAPSRARKRIQTGDVILATVRPTLLRVASVPRELDTQVCSTAFCVLRRDVDQLADRFLYYLVQREEFVGQLANEESGANYPAVTDRIVRAQPVPVPPLEEQNEIVAVLDALDRKADLHRRKRSALDDLFEALLHKLMTGQIRVTDLDVRTR